MKKLAALFIMCSIAIASNANAVILSKEALPIKIKLDNLGATKCSTAIASTIDFIAKGDAVEYMTSWNKTDVNNKTISIDFLIPGSSSSYSKSGTIALTPVGNQCIGTYIYSSTYPSNDCKTYLEKQGFNSPDWQQDVTGLNGDGGNYYFLSPKGTPSLQFIFNDVAGGCALTKREQLEIDFTK